MKNLSKLWGIVFLAAITFSFLSCKQPSDSGSKTVAKPTATPAGGNYTSAQTVTLATKTSDASIYYTFDGTTPTLSSPYYSSPLTIAGTTTLKAIAIAGRYGWIYSEMLTETYTITSTAPTTFTSITDVSNYLASLPSNTKDNPASLTININLYYDWYDLLRAINTAGKYVNLDLSSCTMNGTSFNHGYSKTGVDKIVSLVLPAAARSIGENYNDGFRDYTNLTSISGANIITIGNTAFGGFGATNEALQSLQSVDFPQVTNIGWRAFYGCTSLQSVSFPQTTNIDKYAFYGCTSLQSVSFPQTTNIDEDAFYGCTNLQSVSLPQAVNIGGHAFSGCTSLQSISLPQATSIGGSAFLYCTSLQSVNFPQVTSIGTYTFSSTGTTALSITMGSTAPTLGNRIFGAANKTVTVKVPAGATGYTPASSPFNGTSVTVSGTDTAMNWANGFRGGGWDGTRWGPFAGEGSGPEAINQNIILKIEQQ